MIQGIINWWTFVQFFVLLCPKGQTQTKPTMVGQPFWWSSTPLPPATGVSHSIAVVIYNITDCSNIDIAVINKLCYSQAIDNGTIINWLLSVSEQKRVFRFWREPGEHHHFEMVWQQSCKLTCLFCWNRTNGQCETLGLKTQNPHNAFRTSHHWNP